MEDEKRTKGSKLNLMTKVLTGPGDFPASGRRPEKGRREKRVIILKKVRESREEETREALEKEGMLRIAETKLENAAVFYF